METRHESTSALSRKSVNSIEPHVHAFLRIYSAKDERASRLICEIYDCRVDWSEWSRKDRGRSTRFVCEGYG